MLNFAPTEEQEEIRRLAHSLAVDELRPQARAAEKAGDISPALQRTLAETGLTTPFPESLGGSGTIEAITYTLIAEELAYGDGGLAMNILGSMMGPLTVSLAGDERQQHYFIAPFCDEQEGYKQRGSLAFAERTGGYALADISATARPDGNHYILHGVKRDVLGGANANLRVVLARLEGTTGIDGICAFVIPTNEAGLQVSHDVQKLGLIAAPSAAYILENVAVPTSCMLGEPGNTGVVHAVTLYEILRAGVACGMARAAFEYATNYAKERIAFGRPIASYQGIAFMIAEMAMKLDAARLLVWRATASWDRNGDSADNATLVQEAEAAQAQAIKVAKANTIDAIQVMGGAGFMQDHPAEMWMRNAAAME
ncbi:MAG TPA: acyl-CoA dehydrogenase family protein [Ktedonobacteraceae bacterium]|nr:acyl-CoA dehydrogenase family protein [Ktedonobacteraceae bacterium]